MEKVLLVGEDFPLLATRAAVLSKTGAKVTCCSFSEFETHLGNESFGLVVLCHSVKYESACRVVEETHQRWPKARVLQVVSGLERTSAVAEDVDGVTLAEPSRLVKNVSELLRHDPDIDQ